MELYAQSGIALVVMIVAVASIVLFVCAVVSITRTDAAPMMKVLWFLVALAAPVVGSILWFAVGKKKAIQPHS